MSSNDPPLDPRPDYPAGERLDSWKEIAAYLKRSVRSVQRWEAEEGMPVHRHLHDKRGTIYVTLAPLGEVVAIARDGSQRTIATLPTGEGPSALGLALDARGNVYVAVVTGDPATTGVYRVARDGSAARLPGTHAITFPNGLAFDKRGTLYVTDSIAGAVWRILTPLILDFLAWLEAAPRSYTEVMDAWRTSCPRLTIWEDAVDAGLVVHLRAPGERATVGVTDKGRRMLEAGRGSASSDERQWTPIS